MISRCTVVSSTSNASSFSFVSLSSPENYTSICDRHSSIDLNPDHLSEPDVKLVSLDNTNPTPTIKYPCTIIVTAVLIIFVSTN